MRIRSLSSLAFLLALLLLGVVFWQYSDPDGSKENIDKTLTYNYEPDKFKIDEKDT